MIVRPQIFTQFLFVMIVVVCQLTRDAERTKRESHLQVKRSRVFVWHNGTSGTCSISGKRAILNDNQGLKRPINEW